MKKRIIVTITLLTITLSAFVHGDVKSEYQVHVPVVKPVIKTDEFKIDVNPVSLSKANRSNLSQADGGE